MIQWGDDLSPEPGEQLQAHPVYVRVKCPECGTFVRVALPEHAAFAWVRFAEIAKIMAGYTPSGENAAQFTLGRIAAACVAPRGDT